MTFLKWNFYKTDVHDILKWIFFWFFIDNSSLCHKTRLSLVCFFNLIISIHLVSLVTLTVCLSVSKVRINSLITWATFTFSAHVRPCKRSVIIGITVAYTFIIRKTTINQYLQLLHRLIALRLWSSLGYPKPRFILADVILEYIIS